MSLQINKLSHHYANNKIALNDISLAFSTGVIGLLGANGAGKSSLMRIIATITKPTHGEVLWQGKNIAQQPNELREMLGYLPQSFGLYDNLTATEFLQYIAGLKNLSSKQAKHSIEKLLDLLNLTDVAHKKIGGFSGGMKQRVGIAQALLNDPKLLILDEPTVGLDPEERARFRDLLSELSTEKLIILSTHIVSDVETIADHIAILNKGLLKVSTTPESLLASLSHKVWQAVVSKDMLKEMSKQYCISNRVKHANGMQVRIISSQQPCTLATNVTPKLEDAFLFHSSQFQESSPELEHVA